MIAEIASEMSEEPKYRSLFLASPEVWGIQDMAADGVVIRLVIKTVPGVQWAVGRELRRRIKVAFDRAGIEFPIPQRSVWIRSDRPDSPPTGFARPSVAEGKGVATEGQMDGD